MTVNIAWVGMTYSASPVEIETLGILRASSIRWTFAVGDLNRELKAKFHSLAVDDRHPAKLDVGHILSFGFLQMGSFCRHSGRRLPSFHRIMVG